MNELILQDFPDYPGLVDIGSCPIHVIHNAFGKGLEHYGKDVDQLCLDLYSLFKYSAARREDFKEVQVEMELDTNNFLQHTEVRWLSIGPSIKRILEQWDAITHFVAELAKDSEKVPKSINFKRIYTMLGTKEKQTTRVTLEFLSNVIPVFEKFLLLFQKSSPVVHFLYDEMCEIILKLLRRFIRPQALANKYGSDLASIECQNVKIQLSEPEIVIGEMTRNAMAKLTSDQQKQALLGMRSFFKVTSSQLQVKLPLDNLLLRQLGCLNPLKREKKSTVTSIQSIAMKLQPKVDPSEVTDEWKLFQVDNELPAYDPRERIEVYWNKVSKLQAADGELRYKTLPTVIKSGLVLAQTNAESECSLLVNARIVTKDRALLGEKTIVGLHVIKDAVRFYDPELSRPQMIPVTEELKRSVRQAHSAYRDHLEKEKEEKERKREEARKKKESSERAQREKQKLVQQKEALAKSEEELNEEEVKIRADVEAADELLKEATAKLKSALETKPLNKQSVTVAQMMLETATTKRENAMKQLDKIWNKQKSLDKTTHKLLDEALHRKGEPDKRRKTTAEQRCLKKVKK